MECFVAIRHRSTPRVTVDNYRRSRRRLIDRLLPDTETAGAVMFDSTRERILARTNVGTTVPDVVLHLMREERAVGTRVQERYDLWRCKRTTPANLFQAAGVVARRIVVTVEQFNVTRHRVGELMIVIASGRRTGDMVNVVADAVRGAVHLARRVRGPVVVDARQITVGVGSNLTSSMVKAVSRRSCVRSRIAHSKTSGAIKTSWLIYGGR